MARKTTRQQATRPAEVPTQQVIEPSNIIADGDFAGMTYNEVLEITHNALEEALGPLSIGGALAAQDRLLAQSLALAAYVEGDKFAHEAALKYAQTIMPYIQVEQRIYEQAYKEVLKLKDKVKIRSTGDQISSSWSVDDE
jgi:hypothetical protein